MKKKTYIILYTCLLILSFLPILSILNCEGWNSGTMAFKSCFVDTPMIREFGNTVIGLAYVSSFMGGIPIFIYFGIIIFLLRRIYLVVFKFNHLKKKEEVKEKEKEKEKRDWRTYFIPEKKWSKILLVIWIISQQVIILSAQTEEKLPILLLLLTCVISVFGNFLWLGIFRVIYFRLKS